MNEVPLCLTPEERAMLAGEMGVALRRAVEIVVALGKIYGAHHLIEVKSVQVAGVSYKNLGEAGLEFLRRWAAQGARVRVPTTLNPAGVDVEKWRELGFPADFAHRQQEVIAAYVAMGIAPTCTCTPYLVGNLPSYGDHVAWAESSAVSFANSVLGARTNREGGPSALASAICGRTAAYGLHLDENRLANYRVDVHCPLRTISDWSALGYLVGRQVHNGVPYFVIHDDRSLLPAPNAMPDDLSVDGLKSLGAAMAAVGAVGLYHIAGITPEARQSDVLRSDAHRIVVDDLAPGYAALDGDPERVDLVSIGCPHASPAEIRQVASMVAGRRLRAALWVTTARQTKDMVPEAVKAIQAAGGHVVADTCLVVAPVAQMGFRSLATNSAKMAFYAPSHSRLRVRFGSLEKCIAAATSGHWD